MSDFGSLLDRLHRAYSEIAEIEAVASGNPGDRFVLSNLSEMKRHAEELERDWEEQARLQKKEICRYRILPKEKTEYHVRHVSKSLETFQDLFSQIYDASVNKIRNRARVSEEVARNTAFNIGFTYPGSLGVALTIDSRADLFSADYDEIISSLLELIKLRDEGQVRQVAEQYGVAVVRRTYDWSKANAASDYSIDIGWITSSGGRRGMIAVPNDFRRNVDLISGVSDTETSNLKAYGVLVGIDTQTRRFRFVSTNDGPVYAGSLSPSFPSSQKWAVNSYYYATIHAETQTSYASQETKSTYQLSSLNVEGGSQ